MAEAPRPRAHVLVPQSWTRLKVTTSTFRPSLGSAKLSIWQASNKPVLGEAAPEVVSRERRRLPVLVGELDERLTVVLRSAVGGMGVRRREGHGGEGERRGGGAARFMDVTSFRRCGVDATGPACKR